MPSFCLLAANTVYFLLIAGTDANTCFNSCFHKICTVMYAVVYDVVTELLPTVLYIITISLSTLKLVIGS